MMDWKRWLEKGIGKKLKKLHKWNAWSLLLLSITGILLYFPSLRGATAPFRVLLKYTHIGIGTVSIVLLFLYLPLMVKHLRQLRGKWFQLTNLGGVLFLLIGWAVSGIVLWLEKQFPVQWSPVALLWHDSLTWVGIPWAIYHSISRSRWLKSLDQHQDLKKGNMVQNSPGGQWDQPLTRRAFIRFSVSTLFLVSLGPFFYRWIKTAIGNHGTAIIGSRFESLQPLPESSPPIGGGAKGNFRIYTVTDIPSFQPDQWKFSVSGLVDKPVAMNWREFVQVQRKVQVSDFHCVTGWSVNRVTWEGIPLKQLLGKVGVKPEAKYVKFYSSDGVYTDCLTLDQAMLDDVMIAVLMDGKSIPDELGGPVRLLVPKMYAYKSVKWLQGIELIEKEHIGYWEMRGYDTNAWVPHGGQNSA